MPLDAHRLRTTGVYQASNSLAAISSDLEAIRAAAVRCAASRKSLRWFAGGCLAGGIILSSLAASTGVEYLGYFLYPALISAIGLFIYSFRFGKDFIDRKYRYEFLANIVQLIQPDADSRTPLNVRLQIRDNKRKLKEEPWAQKESGKEQFFEESWLSIDGKLLDGSVFAETITESIRTRSFTNPRGKRKIKSRSQFVLALTLQYSSEVYGDARPFAELIGESLRLPASSGLRQLKVGKKSILMAVRSKALSDLDRTNRAMFLSLYKVLNFSRRMAHTPGGPEAPSVQ
jgi:hypothetical protein